MALQPSPPTSPQQLHGLTGSPPRRGVKSLSPLSSRVAATLTAQAPPSSEDGALPLAPVPPAARDTMFTSIAERLRRFEGLGR